MAIEDNAALVWRFVGILVLLCSIPMFTSLPGQLIVYVFRLGPTAVFSEDGNAIIVAAPFIVIALGAAIIYFSRPLGAFIARGL